MTPSEIIKADYARYGHSEQDVARLFFTMKRLIDAKAGFLLQDGDSVLFITNLDGKKAEVAIYTADSPLKIKSALKHFMEQVKHAGFEEVYGEDGGPVLNKTLAILKKLGLKVQDSDIPRYKWMAKL